MTISEVLKAACADLKAANIQTPSLDASLLLAQVLNLSRSSLLAASEKPLSEKSLEEFNALVQRRRSGECAAYILGKKEFRGLEFSVNSSVLVPRPDTETLVEAALEVLTGSREWGVGSRDIRVLDLCTGSGAVAVSLKNEMPNIEVYAIDICAEALEVAKANASRLLGEDSIKFYQGDLFGALPSPLFHLIVSNPPYIPTEEISLLCAEVQNEPLIALDGGKSGLEIIRRIIDGAPRQLCPGGRLLLEADPRQMKELALLLEKGRFYKIKIYKDLSGQERVIGGVFEK